MSFESQLLNALIFAPIAFAAIVAFLPKLEALQIRVTALLGMVVTLALALWLYFRFAPGGPEFQFEYRTRWIESLGVSYHIGLDGLAVSLVLLTAFLGPLVVLASWTFIDQRVKEFHLVLLLLQTAMIGSFASLDLVVFYTFWEAMLIPMYFIIGIWGSEERVMAAIKFFLFTLAGSLLMLVAILVLYFISQPPGSRSFDYAEIYNALLPAIREVSTCAREPAEACARMSPLAANLKIHGPWMFFAFAIAFAVKVPMFPVHTWLPDAHVQAPTAGSMVLAGVMLKMGTFGFWRYAIPLFPAAAREYRPLFGVLAIIGIVYGALMCLAQRDIKKLIAYSSISHLGLVMLGMFALTIEGANGSAYQMLNHGLSTGALFLMFGMLYERRHRRLISDYGGLARVMPTFSALFLIIVFSSIAVPGTNGFVGEFLVLLGTFKSSLPTAFGVFGALGVVLSAAYMLWMVQRVFFGPVGAAENQRLLDLSLRELVTVLPFVALVIGMGLVPQPFLDRLAPSAALFSARANVGSPGSTAPDSTLRIEVQAAANSTRRSEWVSRP
jgi:NADH-quinone oxidoreductase subunit M